MCRQSLYEVLRVLYPVYNVGQNYKHSNTPYFVLKAMGKESQGQGGFDKYDVMVYVPDTSIVLLDKIISRIEQEVQINGWQYQSSSGDYHDTEIGMYMRSVAVLMPTQTIYNN